MTTTIQIKKSLTGRMSGGVSSGLGRDNGGGGIAVVGPIADSTIGRSSSPSSPSPSFSSSSPSEDPSSLPSASLEDPSSLVDTDSDSSPSLDPEPELDEIVLQGDVDAEEKDLAGEPEGAVTGAGVGLGAGLAVGPLAAYAGSGVASSSMMRTSSRRLAALAAPPPRTGKRG